MEIISEVYEYDKQGRMMYHPDFHFNHGKTFTESDLEYMCKYYEADGPESIAMALGKTMTTICSKMTRLRKEGLVEHYGKLDKHW